MRLNGCLLLVQNEQQQEQHNYQRSSETQDAHYNNYKRILLVFFVAVVTSRRLEANEKKVLEILKMFKYHYIHAVFTFYENSSGHKMITSSTRVLLHCIIKDVRFSLSVKSFFNCFKSMI